MKHPSITAILAALLSPLAYAGNLAGLWEFADENDLGKATVGNDLVVNGTAPTWASTETYNAVALGGVITTQFGTANFLKMDPGIAANGGGSFINQYTLVFDVRRPDVTAWRSFFQTAGTATANDADYFVRGSSGTLNSLGVAAAGYTPFVLPADSWHRLVLSVDLSVGSMVTRLTNAAGVTQSFTHTTQALDGRFSLLTNSLLLFADNDGDNHPLTIGTVAFYDGALDAAQVGQLGGPGAAITTFDPPKSLTWTGALGAEWSTGVLASPKNWVLSDDGVTVADFADGDTVRFGDSASGTSVGITNGEVRPLGMVFDHSSKNFSVTGSNAIAGSSGLQKSGTGTLVIGNANTFSGPTVVTGGILRVNQPEALSGSTVSGLFNSGTIILGPLANATFGGLGGDADLLLASDEPSPQAVALSIGGNNQAAVYGGELSGPGSLTKTGSGTQALTLASTFAGGTTVTGGTIRMQAPAALGTGAVVHNGGQVRFSFGNGTSETVSNDFTLRATGHQTFVIRGTADAAPTEPTTVTLTGKISGGAPGEIYRLLDTTAGGNHNNVLVLTNPANDFQGTIQMWRGTLAITSDSVLGHLDNDIIHYTENINGAIRFDAADITLNPGRAITLPSALNARPFDTNGFNARIEGPLDGNAQMIKKGDGKLTLAGATTFTGAVGINAGTLALEGDALLGSVTTITVAGGAGFDITAVADQFTLGGGRFLRGEGSVFGQFNAVGTVSPGAAAGSLGTLTFQGGITLAGGTLALDFDSRTAQADRVVIAGDLTLDDFGFLDVTDLAGAEEQSLPAGTKIALVEYTGSINGLLDINNELEVADGATVTIGTNSFVLAYADTTDGANPGKFLTLTVTGTPVSGFAAWAAANAPGQSIDDDHDNDGVPNGIEYFMGETGSGFTALPGITNGKIAWPKGASYAGVYGTDYVVQRSTNLQSWTDVPAGEVNDGNPLEYTLPTGEPRIFTRLKVTGP